MKNILLILSILCFTMTSKLIELAELEKKINETGHLPEIPTAEEVKKNGINIGQMQVKLLQKIEELTLYIIQQDKKIKELENKIQNK